LAARGCGTEQAVRTLLRGFAYQGETTEAAYAWLEERLSRCQPKTALRQGVQVSLLVSILTRAPYLLLRPPESLQRKWDMLLEVGISEVEALAMLRTFPATLGYSKRRYLSHAKLLEELGVESGLSIIVRFPPMLGLGPEALRDRFQLLSEFGLDASLSFSRFPGLLGLSDELLRIKLRYYTTVLHMEPDLLGVRAPGILGLSLQQRVRPRVAALLHVASAAGMELPNSTSLATLLKLGDSDFVRRGLLAKRYLGCASDLATVPQFKAFASAPETVARLEAWEDRQRGLWRGESWPDIPCRR